MLPEAVRRSNVLTTYKRMLIQAKLLPADKMPHAIKQIREGFRENKFESDQENIENLLRKASSSLGFIKIMTPKRGKGTLDPQSGFANHH
jgi:hypothetical protein